MRKIPTVFLRDPENMSRLLREYHPDCLWVRDGEGLATRKWDGTCVLIADGRYYKRREVNPAQQQPENFQLLETDETTGKRVGWVEVDQSDPSNKWHMEGLKNLKKGLRDPYLPPSTFELCGPKIQGNPENLDEHTLIAHGVDRRGFVPRDYDGLRLWLESNNNTEGLVFWHPDGRRAKIKCKDFGIKRRVPEGTDAHL